jgi:histidinol-phosphate/aromatic aminotransferase/cobyric acid decarboxylase-like protein
MMTLLAAGSSLPFFNEPVMAQLSSLGRRMPPGAVKINANENPLGPCPAALEALLEVARKGGRYQYFAADELAELVASLEGLEPNNVLPYAGSSLALHHCVLTFTSPGNGLVTVDPGYEAAARAASFVGANVTRVPLVPLSAAHDIPGMLAAGDRAGLFYVCNPNNPTGTVTPRKQIEKVLENKPSGSVLLLDEAYIHFSDEPWGSDLVKAGEDVIVLRTFSKIYGMAGLRAGFALARPDLLAKMKPFSAGALPVTGMAAAKASLLDKEVVPLRKKSVASIREGLRVFMKEHGYAMTPSVSCKFMVDTRRPVGDVIRAMAEQNVFIGRPWPAWPTHARVSIGTEDEMEKFKAAFLRVMDQLPERG